MDARDVYVLGRRLRVGFETSSDPRGACDQGAPHGDMVAASGHPTGSTGSGIKRCAGDAAKGVEVFTGGICGVQGAVVGAEPGDVEEDFG